MTDLGTLRQHQLLTRLLGLARRQGEALRRDRLDEFLALMDVREQIITELVAIEREPPPANVLPLPTIQPTATDPDVRAAMRGLVRSILEQDDANEQALRTQMGALRDALTRLGRGTRASRGYAVALSRPQTGSALDQQC
ncbi:MAG: hypothetical protein C4290_01055 [Chloroflexota bacterium]